MNSQRSAETAEEINTLTRDEYDDLVDGVRQEATMRGIAAAFTETLTDGERGEYLAAPASVAFWRRRRRLTQRQLAGAIGVSQPYIALLENGQCKEWDRRTFGWPPRFGSALVTCFPTLRTHREHRAMTVREAASGQRITAKTPRRRDKRQENAGDAYQNPVQAKSTDRRERIASIHPSWRLGVELGRPNRTVLTRSHDRPRPPDQ